MPGDTIIFIVLYFFIAIPFLISYYKKHKSSPVLFFVMMQVVMFTGIITAPQAKSENGNLLITFYVLALFFYILGVSFSTLIYEKRNSVSFHSSSSGNLNLLEAVAIRKKQYYVIFFLIIISVLACLWFYAKAGMNLFVLASLNFFTDNLTVFRDERFSFFDIQGVGYIYQLRTVILPAFNLFLLFGEPVRKYRRWGWYLFPISLIFLLGTGQRNAFVFLMAFLIVYLILLNKNNLYRVNPRKLLLFGLAAVFFLIVMTVANGRVSDESSSVFVGALWSIFERIFSINSKSALAAFDYIQTQPTVWGYDWMMMLADILPGKTNYLSVDRIVYYIAYGNYSGSGPPCIWGSAWYNWSYFGVTVFPFLLGFFYQQVYFYFKNRRRRLDLFFNSFFRYIWLCGPWEVSIHF